MTTPAQLFKHQPHLLDAAFELWQNEKYNHFHKAFFILEDVYDESTKNEILNNALHFKFEPDVIQNLGALRAEDGKTMRYNESFLNMLQRLDFQSLKISFEDVTFHNSTWFSIKSTALTIEVFRLVLTTWLRNLHVIIS